MTEPRKAGPARSFLDAVLAGSAPTETNGCILWPYSTTQGYGIIRVNHRKRYVGHMVLEHFVGPKPTPKHTMGHAPHEVCGHRNCVAPQHLSWQTRTEQAAQQRRDGTAVPPQSALGQAHAKATVSDDDVRRAVARVRAGETFTAVAQDFGVHRQTVAGWAKGRLRRSSTAAIDPTSGEVVEGLTHLVPKQAETFKVVTD